MAAYSRVSPDGWEQGDDGSASSRVTPTGWEQVSAATPTYTHPTLSLATATEIGATSFKPRVTYTFA